MKAKKSPLDLLNEPGYCVRIAPPHMGGDNVESIKMTLGEALVLASSFVVEGDMEISIIPPQRQVAHT